MKMNTFENEIREFEKKLAKNSRAQIRKMKIAKDRKFKPSFDIDRNFKKGGSYLD